MRSRTPARSLLVAAAALVAALSAARAFGQEVALAQKIDEVGMVGGCDHGARLDNFAIELQNRPDANALIIAYGPDGKHSGTGDYRLRITKSYLVMARGIDAGRIKTINGGPYREKDEALTELWLIPPGAPEPEPAKYKNDAARFKGKYAEYQGFDETFGWDEGTGPPVGDSRLAGFGEVLRLQPKLVGYVVVYNGGEDAPGAWRRIGESEAESLRADGVEADRVKVLFGGYRKETTVRLWALPADAAPPVKGNKVERRPERAAQIGGYDQYFLKYEENERRAFRGFAEVLKADKDLNVCVVVRLGLAKEEEFDPDARPDPKEPPDIDVLKLAETWRARLSKEYGIGEHKFIIMVATARQWQTSGDLETWVVPPGAPLPDPSANDEGNVDEEDAENP